MTPLGIAGTAKWPKSTNPDTNENIEKTKEAYQASTTDLRQHNNILKASLTIRQSTYLKSIIFYFTK